VISSRARDQRWLTCSGRTPAHPLPAAWWCSCRRRTAATIRRDVLPISTNSCPMCRPRTSRSTAPASSSSTTRSSATSTCRSSPSHWPADPSQRLLTYTAEPGSPSQYAPRLLARWPRPPPASSRPPRLIPRSRLNRSGGLTDMGNKLKSARVGLLGNGRSLSQGRSHLRHQYLGGRYAGSASPRTPIAQSETATFANGWLTENDQGPVALIAIGPLTRCFVVAGTGFEPVTSGL
jgi:hypothetical protein